MNTLPSIPSAGSHPFRHHPDMLGDRQDRLQELCEERCRYLTEDRPGLSLVTEALYSEESGYPLDEALFALLCAWRNRANVLAASGRLVRLLEHQAERMARRWAALEVAPATPDFDDDVPW